MGVLQGQIGIWLNPNDGICHMRSPFKDSWRNKDFFGTSNFHFLVKFNSKMEKRKCNVKKKSSFLHGSLKGDLIWLIPSFGSSQMPIWLCRTPTGFHKLLWKYFSIHPNVQRPRSLGQDFWYPDLARTLKIALLAKKLLKNQQRFAKLTAKIDPWPKKPNLSPTQACSSFH